MDRSKIAARIRALLSKTVENGATEGEAIAAALKARELMQTYQIDMSEAELLENGFDGQDSATGDPESFAIQMEIWHGVSLFTGTHAWRNTTRRHFRAEQPDMFGGNVRDGTTTARHESLHFFGLKGDVAFAIWLTRMLEGFVKRGAIQYIADLQSGARGSSWEVDGLGLSGGSARKPSYKDLLLKRESFIVGAARRINDRLIEEYRKQATSRPRGTGLVPVDKNALIAAEMKRRGIVLSKGRAGAGMRAADNEAYGAGKDRGNAASFNRPVNAGAGVRMIGG